MQISAHRCAILAGVAVALLVGLATGPVAATTVGTSAAVTDVAASNVSAATSGGQPVVASCADSSPADHADPDGGTPDVIGWVDGYWYDEPIDVDTTDGLDDAERQRLVARTAARVEALRCSTYDELPPVEVQSRSEYATTISAEIENESERTGQLMNAEAAAMLLVGTDEDWADVQSSVLTGGVGAFYEPDAEQITMIVEEPDDVPREVILAHELVHALQDQQFDLDRFDANLRSTYDAQRGVIEGEATRIQTEYTTRCESDRWGEDCVTPGEQELPELDNFGVVLLFEGPYLYGPAFVEAAHRRAGWSAVADLYGDMPEHSLHVVAPETYQQVDVELPAVEDRSDANWERVGAAGRPDYDVVGQAALTSMFVAPALEPETDDSVVSLLRLLNASTGQVSEFDQPETSGWRGDRLYAYSNGDDLASAWVLEWVDGEEAQRFADAYEQLVAIRGGEPVDERDGVYRFSENSRFDGAVRVRVVDERVSVVTAPSVTELSAVHGESATGGSDGLSGFGVLGTLLAVSIGSLTAARRSVRGAGGRRGEPDR